MTRLEAWFVAGLVALTFGFLTALVVTSGFWFRLNSLTISDAKAGGPVFLQYDREFFRDFHGSWIVAIWQNERGEWGAYCAANGEWPYKTAHRVSRETLEWLTDGDCHPLPPGEYRVEVELTSNPGTVLARSQSIVSNVFEVAP